MMPFQPVILLTDSFVYLLVIVTLVIIIFAKQRAYFVSPWQQVMRSRLGVVSLVILLFYILIGLLDSIHFRPVLEKFSSGKNSVYSTQVKSLLDVLIKPLGETTEKTYSAPFATTLYSREAMQQTDGKVARVYPPLQYAGNHLKNANRLPDILKTLLFSFAKAILIWLVIISVWVYFLVWRAKLAFFTLLKDIALNKTLLPWRCLFITLGILLTINFAALALSSNYHILGTDKIGHDIFYHSLKSIRTGLIIGTLTTLIMLPFAILFGMMAGFFQGLIDDIVQYVYTTLSSVPAVLLIAAAVLSLQVFIANHSEWFTTIAARADIRLFALCAILGITSWTNLCRLIRGETLKLKELSYVQAAEVLGAKPYKIMQKHILPNLQHIIIITVVLDFSGLVLAEAVLSYVGVGVDPSMQSFGNMINEGRLELAREPIVWWPLFSAFIFMFILVLSANLFADVVRDAFDPRINNQ